MPLIRVVKSQGLRASRARPPPVKTVPDLGATKEAAVNRAAGGEVWIGGPAVTFSRAQRRVRPARDGRRPTVGIDERFEREPGAYPMVYFSRGCPAYTPACGLCPVPRIEGNEFRYYPDATPAPLLLDNNLSALPADYQEHIIGRYRRLAGREGGRQQRVRAAHVHAETLKRWEAFPLACWRFGYDDLTEREQALEMMRLLKAHGYGGREGPGLHADRQRADRGVPPARPRGDRERLPPVAAAAPAARLAGRAAAVPARLGRADADRVPAVLLHRRAVGGSSRRSSSTRGGTRSTAPAQFLFLCEACRAESPRVRCALPVSLDRAETEAEAAARAAGWRTHLEPIRTPVRKRATGRYRTQYFCAAHADKAGTVPVLDKPKGRMRTPREAADV
jgi:hypothetical protein